MTSSRTDTLICIALFIVSLVVFTRGLGVHGAEYRDDEIFYYKSTQEMLATGDVLSPKYFGENRFQKPILYYWFVLLSYGLFGANWFSARLVAVIFAGLTISVTWLIGKTLFNRRVATLGAVILSTIPLFFRHAKNAVPDMPLNFFIVLAFYAAVRFLRDPSKQQWNIAFFVSCALGFMVKGFAALIFPMGAVILYALWIRQPGLLKEMRFGRGLGIMLLIMCPWFLYMIHVHGQDYLNYMLVDETKNRLLNTGGRNVAVVLVATFFEHALFYLEVLGSYFAPWSLFMIGALPLAVLRARKPVKGRAGLRLMLVWFALVFAFFSTMYFCINHYMLVLTTPFALLTSYFFLEKFNSQSFIGKTIMFLRKYLCLLIMTFAFFAYAFLLVFLAGAAKGWLIVLVCVYGLLVRGVSVSLRPMAAPLALGLFLVFVLAQSSLLAKAGVTNHAVLQEFAAVVRADVDADAVIGVGSHDIHEKEFQVYFDRRVIKAAGSEAQETRVKLENLFSTEKAVYCLITAADFDRFLKGRFPKPLVVLREEDMVRRRMALDTGFFAALVRMDRPTVSEYLKEKILLVKKGHDAPEQR